MKEQELSHSELMEELAALRRRVKELEAELPSSDRLAADSNTKDLVHSTHQREGGVDLSDQDNIGIQADYRSVVQTASEAICITQDGMIRFANHAGAELTGYSEEELVSMAFAVLVHPDDLEELVRINMMRLRGENVPPGHRFRIITKTGTITWVESWSVSIVWNGQPAVLSMIRDVSGQVQDAERLRHSHIELDKQVQERTVELQAINEKLVREAKERERAELSARESEERFRKLLEHSPLGIAVASTNGEIEFVNNKFVESYGYTLEDIPTVEHWWHLAYPDDQHGEKVKSEWLQATKESAETGEEAAPVEREVRCKDGTMRVVDFRKTATDTWVIHTFHDITDKKKQEEALRESEQMFRLLSEQSLMSIAILQDGVYKYANDAMSDLCEYSLDKILNWGPEDFLAVVHPADRTLVMEQARMKQIGDARQQINYEFRINTKSGIVKWVEIYSKTIQYKGRPANLLTMLDITERKSAEEATRESENRYRSLVETSPDPIITYDLHGNLISVNQRAAMAYGVDSAERLLSEIKNVSDMLDEDSRVRALSNLRKAGATGASRKSEYTVIRKDGGTLPVEINTSAVRDSDGAIVAFISVVRDVADRKRREEELRQSRAIISSILNSVPQSIFWKDRNSVYLGCNEVFARAVGLQSPDQIVGKTDYDLPWPRPEADAYRADDSEVMHLNRPKHHIIEPLQQADGSRLLIDTSKVPLADENRGVYGVLGVYDDITERVKAEAALRKLEDLYRNVIENIEDVFYRSDRQGRLLMGSPSGARLFGYESVEEMIGLSLESFWVDPGDSDKLIAQIEKSGTVKDFEGLLKRKDGSTFVASFTTHLYRDETGEVQGTQGIIRDITAHKDAERKLRHSEERLRLAWDTSPDYFSISRFRDGLMVDVNRGFTKLTGYNRDEVLGRRSQDFQLWCDPHDRQKFISELSEHGEIRSFETRFRRKDGETRACELSAGLMDLNGEPHILALAKDIEDAKRAQAALVKSEELFRKYFELGLVGMALASPEKGWVYVNDRICEMLGYTREELVKTTWTTLTHPDDLEPDLAQFDRMLAGEIEGYSMDKRYVRKDGELIYATLHVTCIRKADGTVDHVIAHVHDISEKKQSEEALRKSEQLLRQVLDTVPVRIFWKDADSVFLGCNRLFALDAGLQSPEDLVGRTDFDFGWRDQAARYREDDRQVIESGGEKINYEEPQTTPDGTRIWLRTNKVPLLDPDGLIKGVLGTYEDITERKSAEEALRRSEERYRAFVANTTEGIWRFELDQPIATSLPIEEQIDQIFQHAYVAECNDATARMYGLDRAEDLIGVRWKDMAGHDSRNIEFIRSFIRSGYRLMGAESLEMDRDGNVRCFMNSMVGLLENGHIVRAWGVQRDITEQKRAEEALREANLVVERSPVVLFRWKATDGLPVTMVSKNVVQFGYTREELLSGTVPFASMVHPQDRDRVIREVQEYSASGAARFRQEYRIMTKAGEFRWVDNHTVVERDGDSRIVFFQGTLIDITERKTFEKSLQEKEKLLD